MNKVLYTAVFDNYDNVSIVDNQKGWRRLLFTNTGPDKVPGWEVIKVKKPFESGALSNRYYKLNPHLFFKHDISVYIDGNFDVVAPLDEFIQKMGNLDMMAFDSSKKPSNSRNCIYQEAQANIDQHKADKKKIQKQVLQYRNEGYPENNGLISGAVLVRRNTEKMRMVMNAWWNELQRHTHRDMLSFNYVAWKYKFNYLLYPAYVRSNKWFQMRLHIKDRDLNDWKTNGSYHLQTFIPYSIDKNLGYEYNRCMGMIGENDWAVLCDHDMMFLPGSDWYKHIRYAIESLPNAGLITVTTNRIANKDQLYGGVVSEIHDIKHHKAIMLRIKKRAHNRFIDATNRHLIGGVVMITSKRAWEKAGHFPNGLISIDNLYHQRIRDAGFKVYIMQGLYVYHWRRGDGPDTNAHLR